MEGPKGASRDKANLDYWAERASANSDGDKHRAKKSGLPPLSFPREAGAATGIGRLEAAAKADRNSDDGSSFMRKVRRTATE